MAVRMHACTHGLVHPSPNPPQKTDTHTHAPPEGERLEREVVLPLVGVRQPRAVLPLHDGERVAGLRLVLFLGVWGEFGRGICEYA